MAVWRVSDRTRMKARKKMPRGKRLSEGQQRGNEAMRLVMRAWNELEEEERRAWNAEGSNRRTKGIRYFKKVNLRRLGRGEELARVPLRSKAFDGRPLLKRLLIRNRDGRITLWLELRRAPSGPTTVWGARPCNPGRARPFKCPRLGWLPESQGRMSDITGPYFQKHAGYIWKQGVPLVRMRIFIQIRQERDDGASLFEQVSAVVPAPAGGSRKPKKG